MPPPLVDVDWNVIKAFFVAGATIDELTEQFSVARGSIAARCAREDWMAFRPENRLQARANASIENGSQIWTERAARHRDSMNRISERLVKHVEMLDDSAILAKVEKVKVVDDMARRNLGLDTQGTPTLNVAVGLLNGFEGPEMTENVQIVSDFSVCNVGSGADTIESVQSVSAP